MRQPHMETNEMREGLNFHGGLLKSALRREPMGLMNTFASLCHRHNEIPQKMPVIDESFTYIFLSFPLGLTLTIWFLWSL